MAVALDQPLLVVAVLEREQREAQLLDRLERLPNLYCVGSWIGSPTWTRLPGGGSRTSFPDLSRSRFEIH